MLAEALQSNHVLTSLLCHAEGEGAEVLVEALSCNSKHAGDPQAAGACKTRLAPYLAASASLINKAVTAQAQLETQQHKVEMGQPHSGGPPSVPPPPPTTPPLATHHAPPASSPPPHPPSVAPCLLYTSPSPRDS